MVQDYVSYKRERGIRERREEVEGRKGEGQIREQRKRQAEEREESGGRKQGKERG